MIWYDPSASPSANKPLANVNLTSGNAGYLYADQVVYKSGGNWLTNGTVNGQRQFYRGNEPVRSWTPTLIGSTGGTAAMSTQVGNYAVNNGVVTMWGRVVTTSLAGLTGNLRVGGLPVTPINAADDFGVCSFGTITGWTAPAGFSFLGGMMNGNNGAFVLIRRMATNGAAGAETAVGEWAAASTVTFSCSYHY